MLFSLANAVYGQGSAFIFIEEEHNYPADEHTKIAQKQYTWIINGKPIKYKTGKYEIKINPAGQFDTIRFQNIKTSTSTLRSGRKVRYDTAITVILCSFRKDHNYNLGQIYPGHFEFFSLDTFETRKSFTLKTVNKSSTDTLYLDTRYSCHSIFSDTAITIATANELMNQSFVEYITLDSNKRSYTCYGPVLPDATVFHISYLYLHAENIEIEYDFATKAYRLRLVN
jgi:hypothetical protein